MGNVTTDWETVCKGMWSYLLQELGIYTKREGPVSAAECDYIYFSLEGGINVEENWDKVVTIKVPVLGGIDEVAAEIDKAMPVELGKNRELVANFLRGLYRYFAAMHFAYLEINPFAIAGKKIVPLDMVAKLDDTAEFLCTDMWGSDIEFPAAFGQNLSPEEIKIRELDALSGASLKLTLLNPEGIIWNMVAGGGEGSTPPGRHPVTPWGKPTLGYRTRKKNKLSDRYIVRGRRRGKKR